MDVNKQVVPENSPYSNRGHGGSAPKEAKIRERAWLVGKRHKKIEQGLRRG